MTHKCNLKLSNDLQIEHFVNNKKHSLSVNYA
jgi:hypothetical protein